MGAATGEAGSLRGRYRMGEVIGRGGMAAVVQARDELLGRDVAVKIFRTGAAGEDEIRRQRTEVKLLASLSHHSVVTLLDAGVDIDDDGSPHIYLVMELVRGPDLKERLARGPLSALEIAQIGYDLAEGLEYLHVEGVVHRDVKPANILLVEPGSGRLARAKLTDFGIADLEGRVPSSGEQTTGTAAYLSPEQARRDPVTGASDVYSLGLVLLECFTGTVAFPGGVVESALRRLTEDPVVPDSVPPAWRDVLTAMTARDPADRPGVAELVLTLRQLVMAESGVQPALVPHPAPAEQDREAARLSAVHRYGVLDTAPEPSFDRLTALAARVLDAPVSILSIVDADRIWFKSHHGIDLDQIDRDPGLCASAILQDAPWIIEDARVDPRAQENPLVTGEFGLQFYAGVPLRTSDGHNLGTLCVLDFEPRGITDDEVATLQDLASVAVTELDLRMVSAGVTAPFASL
ncbi:protein kinase [Naasia sp. SYSU D00057]|uniref:protein kinase domain-containing protein n=1 Tax=Naasia sp. SYSU D00057 TaxID=2817380 RepID=UPI0027DD475E|nr:protein kinase [Naasia sp. SYSU D00057]